MALFENMFKGGAGSGLVIGLGMALLAPVVLPAVARVARPIAKTVIKTGITLYRETLSEVGQIAGEIYSEAQAELGDPEDHVAEEADTKPVRERAARAPQHATR